MTGGSITRWVRFDDVAVLEEPFLTSSPGRPPQIHVVVADPELPALSGLVESDPYARFSTIGLGFPNSRPAGSET